MQYNTPSRGHLAHPDIKAVNLIKINRCWSLVFDDDLSKAIVDMKDNTSTEVTTLHKAAKIQCQEYLQMWQALYVFRLNLI